MSVCCECCVLSGRGLCDALITRPEESYRLRCVVVCDLETSRMMRSWPSLGRSATGKKKVPYSGTYRCFPLFRASDKHPVLPLYGTIKYALWKMWIAKPIFT